jgi:hypothetical protein
MSEADFTYNYRQGGAALTLRTFHGLPEVNFHTSKICIAEVASLGHTPSRDLGRVLRINTTNIELQVFASDEQLSAIASAITAALAKKEAA